MTATLPRMSEKQLQRSVLDLARSKGWRCYHTFDSRRSEPGFPDIIAIRGERLVAIELKSDSGTLTEAQTEWLRAFDDVWVVDAIVIRPAPTLDEVEVYLR
jgi:hypothetical protein